MKKLLLIISVSVFASCSNLQSDAEKVCELLVETEEIMPEIMQLSMQSAFGNEDAGKKFEELQPKLDKIGKQIETISSKYNEDEFQSYLLENCEAAKGLKELGEAFEKIGEAIE